MQQDEKLSLLLFPQPDIRKSYKTKLTPFTTQVTLVLIYVVIALDK